MRVLGSGIRERRRLRYPHPSLVATRERIPIAIQYDPQESPCDSALPLSCKPMMNNPLPFKGLNIRMAIINPIKGRRIIKGSALGPQASALNPQP